VVDPQRRRPQGQEARRRGRSARQELASAPGVCAARRHRSQKAGRHHLRRAALLSQKALQGETDATLTYWNFCADLENRGFSRAIAMESIVRDLGAKGPIA